MRPPAFKLLILVLTLFLLLSFLSPAPLFALGRLRAPELDEQPHPGAARYASYFIVLKTVYGFVLVPVFMKSSQLSNTDTVEKSTDSRRANEVVE